MQVVVQTLYHMSLVYISLNALKMQKCSYSKKCLLLTFETCTPFRL